MIYSLPSKIRSIQTETLGLACGTHSPPKYARICALLLRLPHRGGNGFDGEDHGASSTAAASGIRGPDLAQLDQRLLGG